MAIQLPYKLVAIKLNKIGKCENHQSHRGELYEIVEDYHSGQWAGHKVLYNLRICKTCLQSEFKVPMIESDEKLYTNSEMHKKIPLKNDWSNQPLIIVS